MSSDKRKEFEKLLALVGGRAFTDAELAQLNTFLKEEPEWSLEYYEHCHIQALLEEKHGSLASKDELELLLANSEEGKNMQEPKNFPVWIFAVAACLAVGLIIFFKQSGESEGDFVARVKSGLNQSLVNETGVPASTGDQLEAGKYVLKGGLTELDYAGGIKVILEGPAKFEIINKDEMRLTQGKVYALTPPGAKGFTISTPRAVFNDLGTEFAVEYLKDTTTTLFVFKGKVEAVANDGSKQILTDGQALRLSEVGGMKNYVIKEDYFVRQLPTLQHSYQKLIAGYSPVVYLPMEKDRKGQFYNYSTFSPGLVKVENDRTGAGIVGKAFRCNHDNYLSIGAYPKATDAITVSGWLRIDSDTSGIVARNGNDKGQFSISFEKGILNCQLMDRHGSVVNVSPTEVLEHNKWHHFAFVYDKSNVKLYLNSKLTAAKENGEGIYTESLLPYVSVGSNIAEDQSFNGLIDEFAIFNKAMTAEEVRHIFNKE